MDQLKRYLVTLPQALDFEDHGKIKTNVYKALYYAVTAEGQYALHLFANIPPSDLDALADYRWDPTAVRGKPFYKHVKKTSYSHPPGQSCGRALMRGEPVYRCLECGYDSTCVLCVHCFNKLDHVGHTVTMYTSPGEGSGICDCGDETAFVRPLNCSCQQDALLAALPAHFAAQIEATMRAALDYVLDVANFSIGTLPLIHRNINSRGAMNISSGQLSDYCSLPVDAYGACDANSPMWHLVLWNDENHDYPEAETGIRAATGVDDERAKAIASVINSEGRAILKSSPLYTDLLKAQKRAEVDGLVATIMSARDYMREVIVGAIISWLAAVVAFSGNESFKAECRAILPRVFMEPGFQFSKNIPVDFFHLTAPEATTKRHFFENGLLYNGELLNLALTTLKPGLPLFSIMSSVSSVLRPPYGSHLAGSRIQYLLAFEIRLVAHVRKKFIKSLLPVFFVDPANKAAFCEQYMDVYPILLNVFALSDREEQISSFNDIPSQLFTCPKTNMYVVTSGKLCNILGPLSSLIEEHSSKRNHSGLPNLVDVVVDIRSKREKSSIQRVISETINTFYLIVSKNNCSDLMSVFLHQDNMMLFLNFLKYFQGGMELERKYGDHVERELMEPFYSFIQRASPVFQLIDSICSVKNVDKARLSKAALLTFKFLAQRNLPLIEPGIADFRVSKNPVSYSNPGNSFLSLMLQNCDFVQVLEAIKQSQIPFMQISDFSLRSIVLVSQVRVGFWIRNGIAVSRQILYYTNTFMNEVSYFREFHLNQVAVLADKPETSLFNFLHRWELMPWYLGEVSHASTIYEDRFGLICEQFVIFLYVLLTDRFFFDNENSDAKASYRIKKGICYALCEEPMSYTALKTEVAVSDSGTVNFDDILLECANYQPPTGLSDFGMYRLKPEIYATLDPVNRYIDSSKSETVMESLISNIAKNGKIDEKSVILKPDFYFSELLLVNENIGDFTRTKEFAKLIYKLLQHALDTKDELLMSYVLHLTHAVVLDDEYVNGKNHLIEGFVSFPIGDLMMTIADSTMASHVIAKADFLLEIFVSRDDRIIESLIDCFGEDHVQSYKKRKVGLFETDAEKKKRQAEERKAKVMKRFAKQREQFMKQNNIEDDALGEDKQEDLGQGELHCVICGEQENSEELFGLLFSVNESSIFWKIPLSGTFNSMAFEDWDTKIKPEDGKVYLSGYPYALARENHKFDVDGFVAYSCSHGMHKKCFDNSRRNRDHFHCPLCHAAQNRFLPSLQSPPGPLIGTDLLEGDFEWLDSNNFKFRLGTSKTKRLINSTIGGEYLDSNGDLKKSFAEALDWDDYIMLSARSAKGDNKFSNIMDLTQLLANTIRSQEIATRLEGNKGFSNFLEKIPSSSKSLIRSLIQICAISYAKYNITFSASGEDSEFTTESYLADGAFNEAVASFFRLDYSWHSLMRVGLCRAITSAFASIKKEEVVGIMPHKTIDDSQLRTMKSRFNHSGCKFTGANNGAYGDFYDDDELSSKEVCRSVYFAIERSVLPFLRQCTIFTDILTCSRLTEGNFESIEKFKSLKDAIESQAHLDSADALCEVLNLPKIDFILSVTQNTQASNIDVKASSEFFDEAVKNSPSIQYPGVIRLVNLPDDYQDCITDLTVFDHKCNSVCLQCGEYKSSGEIGLHSKKCCRMPIFFKPVSNTLEFLVFLGDNGVGIKLPAPYLTVHGEIKRERQSGKATLNHFRYDYLSRLWLNEGLYGFATRSIFGVRTVPADAVGLDEIFNDEMDSSGDEFDAW